MAMWTLKARQHAWRLRQHGSSNAEIAALLGRTRESVKKALDRYEKDLARRQAPARKGDRTTYNRVEIASMLGMTIDDFMRQQLKLEDEKDMPRSIRARYAVPRVDFDVWLKKHYYPTLTPEQWLEQAQIAFLRSCFMRRPDKEINQAARILQAAQTVLALRD